MKKHNSCLIISKMYGFLTEKQLESARRVISRQTGKFVKIFIKVKPCLPITKKSSESRMGKGKGKFSIFIHNIKPGQKIFEIYGFSNKNLVLGISKNAAKKLPVDTKIIF
jgi:large subunit ribosomal protein L16